MLRQAARAGGLVLVAFLALSCLASCIFAAIFAIQAVALWNPVALTWLFMHPMEAFFGTVLFAAACLCLGGTIWNAIKAR